jgi:hypothetical protein
MFYAEACTENQKNQDAGDNRKTESQNPAVPILVSKPPPLAVNVITKIILITRAIFEF